MDRPRITLVVARAQNGVIGRGGKLPWHLPADLKRFKALTMGSVMVMGRKTFDSLPGLLPGRRHVVLTRDPNWSAEGSEIARSVDEALDLARAERVSVIGGACYSIYLIHVPIIQAWSEVVKRVATPASLAESWLLMLPAIPLALAAGLVFFALIEQPTMKPDWPRRLSQRLELLSQRLGLRAEP